MQPDDACVLDAADAVEALGAERAGERNLARGGANEQARDMAVRGALDEAYVVVPEACDVDNAILCVDEDDVVQEEAL